MTARIFTQAVRPARPRRQAHRAIRGSRRRAAPRRSRRKTAEQLLGCTGSFLRPRLAYRDVASATNRTSLIAAVLPAGVVTTHSLFCLKTFLSSAEQHFLCGMLNSYVANYLVRQVMTTHLGSTTVEELRMPKPAAASPLFREISERCAPRSAECASR